MIVNTKNTTILIEGLEQYTDTPLGTSIVIKLFASSVSVDCYVSMSR